MQWKLRIDLQKCSVNQVVEFLVSSSDAYAYVVEGSLTDNPHIHAYLKTFLDPSRYKLRKLSGGGNGGYSLKKLEDEEDSYPIEYLAYMLKEGDIVYYNIPQDTIDASISYNAKVKSQIKEKKEKLPVWKQIMNTITVPTNLPVIHPLREKRRLIMERVIDYHIEKGLLIRQFQIQSYTDSIVLNMFTTTKYDMIEKWL